ncbi:MAG: nicotinate-nucleotide adenylyltransferase [Paracoccaceae bacterium]
MKALTPFVRPGLRVGLLGGSFDPAHAGHVHITQEALKRFDLDQVWWLITPGNPLKSQGPAALDVRMARAQSVMQHPRVHVTDIEDQLGTRFTAETLAALRAQCLGVNFIWLMGADNLAQFHLWQDWRSIMDTVSVGVLARPGDRISARTSKAARIYSRTQISGKSSHLLGRTDVPNWCFVNVPMLPVSSSAIRESGAWATEK